MPRRPHFEVTMRRMLVVVAATGLVLGGLVSLHRRSRDFEATSKMHWRAAPRVFRGNFEEPLETLLPRWQSYVLEKSYRETLGIKYQAAARRPWWPVPPDPTVDEFRRSFAFPPPPRRDEPDGPSN